MSFPYMNPQSFAFTPSNSLANIAAQPFGTVPNAANITNVFVIPRRTVTGADADYIHMKVLQAGNHSNIIAELNVSTGTNTVANTAQQLTINSSLSNLSANDGVAWTVDLADTANANLGIYKVQVDYVQGSPAAEG